MPPVVRTWMTIALTLIVLLGFTAMVTYGIYQTWTGDTTPSFTDAYLYVATGLTGLVGGIVAAGFGQKPPQTAAGSETAREKTARNIDGLGNLVLAGKAVQAKGIVAAVYAGVYLLLGVVAIVTWVAKSSVTPDLVKNLASVAIGLILPIAQGFFGN